jgi:propionate CoA-transferase
MDERIFRPEPMGLKNDLLAVPLEQRFSYDREENLLFVNFEGLSVSDRRTIDEIRLHVTRICEPLGRKVQTIVNYDNFAISPDLVEEYTAMVKHVVARYYSRVTRFTTSAFLRLKLGDALRQRDVAPHIFESREEARAALEGKERPTGPPAAGTSS